MARHNVTFKVPRSILGNTDIEITVRSDQNLLGTLGISKGGLCWTPADYTYGYRLAFEDLQRVAREYGVKEG